MASLAAGEHVSSGFFGEDDEGDFDPFASPRPPQSQPQPQSHHAHAQYQPHHPQQQQQQDQYYDGGGGDGGDGDGYGYAADGQYPVDPHQQQQHMYDPHQQQMDGYGDQQQMDGYGDQQQMDGYGDQQVYGGDMQQQHQQHGGAWQHDGGGGAGEGAGEAEGEQDPLDEAEAEMEAHARAAQDDEAGAEQQHDNLAMEYAEEPVYEEPQIVAPAPVASSQHRGGGGGGDAVGADGEEPVDEAQLDYELQQEEALEQQLGKMEEMERQEDEADAAEEEQQQQPLHEEPQEEEQPQQSTEDVAAASYHDGANDAYIADSEEPVHSTDEMPDGETYVYQHADAADTKYDSEPVDTYEAAATATTSSEGAAAHDTQAAAAGEEQEQEQGAARRIRWGNDEVQHHDDSGAATSATEAHDSAVPTTSDTTTATATSTHAAGDHGSHEWKQQEDEHELKMQEIERLEREVQQLEQKEQEQRQVQEQLERQATILFNASMSGKRASSDYEDALVSPRLEDDAGGEEMASSSSGPQSPVKAASPGRPAQAKQAPTTRPRSGSAALVAPVQELPPSSPSSGRQRAISVIEPRKGPGGGPAKPPAPILKQAPAAAAPKKKVQVVIDAPPPSEFDALILDEAVNETFYGGEQLPPQHAHTHTTAPAASGTYADLEGSHNSSAPSLYSSAVASAQPPADLADLQTRYDQLTVKYQQSEALTRAFEKELEETQLEVEDLETKLSAATEQLQQRTTEAAQLKRALVESAASFKQTNEEQKVVEQQLATLTKAKADLERRVTSAENARDAAEAQSKKANADMMNLQRQLEQVRTQVTEYMDWLRRKEQRIDDLERIQRRLEAQLEDTKHQWDAAEERATLIGLQLEDAKEVANKATAALANAERFVPLTPGMVSPPPPPAAAQVAGAPSAEAIAAGAPPSQQPVGGQGELANMYHSQAAGQAVAQPQPQAYGQLPPPAQPVSGTGTTPGSSSSGPITLTDRARGFLRSIGSYNTQVEGVRANEPLPSALPEGVVATAPAQPTGQMEGGNPFVQPDGGKRAARCCDKTPCVIM